MMKIKTFIAVHYFCIAFFWRCVMSKLYNEYLKLKEKDNNKLYLFKSGKFYIFWVMIVI